MIRFGLCCQFKEIPIKFRTVTLFNLKKEHINKGNPYLYLSELILDNIKALQQAITKCAELGIGSFRVCSQFLPLASHPEIAYRIEDLPDASELMHGLSICRDLAKRHDIRLTFHPDQFILINSPSREIVQNSIAELEYHNSLANLIGADVIVIHAGGVYQDKKTSLRRLVKNLEKLSPTLREKLTVENDDCSYSPEDLLPICISEAIALTYDVHHHRCLKDSLSIEEATEKAFSTWNREPLFHISSPKNGWSDLKTIRQHHDYIDIYDFPSCWKCNKIFTVDIEAKAKEVSIIKLRTDLQKEGFL